MIPRIKSIIDRNDYKLEVLFDDGRRVLYDVNEDINQIPDFKDLISIKGLWKQFVLDESRTCVYWNDRIDLASDSIYEYGKIINSAKPVVTEECPEVTDAQMKKYKPLRLCLLPWSWGACRPKQLRYRPARRYPGRPRHRPPAKAAARYPG